MFMTNNNFQNMFVPWLIRKLPVDLEAMSDGSILFFFPILVLVFRKVLAIFRDMYATSFGTLAASANWNCHNDFFSFPRC